MVAAEMLDLRPGERVLDWGSGCGWTLSWFRIFYGTQGFGIEASRDLLHWAQRHSAGEFCLWSSTDLSWIPDNTFDAVVSYWAMYHLESTQEQCRLAKQFVAKLRPGGRIWIGGNCPSDVIQINHVRMNRAAWQRCLRGLSRGRQRVSVDFFTDAELFLTSGRPEPEAEDNVGAYMFYLPTFSVVIRKPSI